MQFRTKPILYFHYLCNVENQDEKFMREALREAQAALAAGEIPIGAVIVSRGRVIGRGHNMTERLIDTTAHAEMVAITAATEAIGGKYLTDCTLYVTVDGPRWAALCTGPSTPAAATRYSPLPSSTRVRRSRPASWAKNARP